VGQGTLLTTRWCPHNFPELEMVPAKAQGFAFYDFDLPLLWRARQDVEEYLASWPDSVVGETYEVGAVGQPPCATAPVNLGNYPAGLRIEP
jgi:hypothetical protein